MAGAAGRQRCSQIDGSSKCEGQYGKMCRTVASGTSIAISASGVSLELVELDGQAPYLAAKPGTCFIQQNTRGNR
jgi:hypothetical protein